eukprot:COSAG06_NODE_64466_length_259_cov_0.962500_1_plen_52_part_10
MPSPNPSSYTQNAAVPYLVLLLALTPPAVLLPYGGTLPCHAADAGATGDAAG